MKSKKNIKSIIVIAAILVASLMFLNMSLAANSSAKVIVETANLRENTSSNSKILLQMSINDEVEIIEKTDEWYKVKYKNQTGYVKSNLLSTSKETQNTTSENQTTNNETQNTIANTQNTITSENETEKETNTQPKEESKNEEGELGKYTITDDTKLKLVPLINATDMIEIKKAKEVNVVKIVNGWAYVEVDTIRGWIRTEKMKSESQLKEEEQKAKEDAKKAEEEALANAQAIKTSYVKSETVNLRKENNTTSEIVGNIPQNTAVEVLSEENGWSKSRVSGLIGYISSEYLSDEKVKKQETTTSRGSTQARANTQKNSEEKQIDTPASSDTSSVIAYAKQFLGYSYVYGGNGPSSFDCSGFTSYVFRQFGVSLNRTAGGQLGNGTSVTNLQAGDLVMFGTQGNIYHVGIYMGADTFIHAANQSRGVTTDRLSTYANYYGARRVL